MPMIRQTNRVEVIDPAHWIDLSEESTDEDGYVEIVNRFICSNCGKKEMSKSDYCRRCGAKMNGGEENE